MTMQFISADVATICTGIMQAWSSSSMCRTKGKRSALLHSRNDTPTHGGASGQADDMEITVKEIQLKRELYEIIANHSGNE